MLAVRLTRALALAIVGALVAFGATFAVAVPASATAGLIDGFVYELDGTTPIVGATITFDDGSSPSAYVTTSTNGVGYYSFVPPVGFDGEAYAVYANGGANHLDDYAFGVYLDADATSGENDFVLGPGRRITGIVRDAGTGLGVPDVIVSATGATYGPFLALPPTDSTGTYSIAVTPGDTYEVQASDVNNDYEVQLYDHNNGCGCGGADEVSVPAGVGPVTDIDFDLLAFDDWILFSVLAQRAPTPVDYPGVLIYLDRWDGAAWQQVDSHVTDSTGIAELYGYAPTPQDFRVRFSIGGVTQTILSYDDYIGPPFPPWDGGASVHLQSLVAGGCGCGGSFVEQDLDLLFAATPATGGGTSTPPATSKPRPRVGTNAVATTVAPTATPTPTPTPTSTPSPTPSQTGEPSPSASPTADPQPTQNVFDLWWLWLLLLLIVAAIVFFIVRAILRR